MVMKYLSPSTLSCRYWWDTKISPFSKRKLPPTYFQWAYFYVFTSISKDKNVVLHGNLVYLNNCLASTKGFFFNWRTMLGFSSTFSMRGNILGIRTYKSHFYVGGWSSFIAGVVYMHTLYAFFALNMCFKFVFDFDENYIFIINRTVYVFLLDSSLSLRVPRERSSLVNDSINTSR